jgi:glutamate synthase domain-containing protein 3
MLESNNKKNEIKVNKMFEINAAPNGEPLDYRHLNEQIHQAINDNHKEIVLQNVCGQRFIAASLQGNLKIVINGIPGNDLGIFMDGPEIIVNGNCEDQAGNTMNDGKMIIYGDTGDVIGLSARGGKIFIKKDVGYRVGIHIKEYENQFPVLIFGGVAKDFLGEYMAGGLIIALGLKFLPNGTIIEHDQPICGKDLGTGIHRGKIVLRTEEDLRSRLGKGAKLCDINEKDMKEIKQYLEEFCDIFNVPFELVIKKPFKIIKPISKRPFGGNYCGQII